MITQAELKERLAYDPETGVFTWIKSGAKGSPRAGDVAGSVNSDGYWTIRFNKRLLYAHRIAFIYMTGECPAFVDHRDTCKSNNVWTNLRCATRAQNEQNKGITRSNTSGIKGVSWHKQRQKWCASIRVDRRHIHLGLFEKIELAAEFRQLAADMHHGTFARHA